MGKKKVKDRSAGTDSSSETAGPSCTHIRKGTENSVLKKACLNEHWSSCQDCEQDKPEEKQILEDQTDGESPAVWMCLKCGHRGCGRSGNQHAIKHYETPRSEPHCLVLSLDVWSVWCYICDDEVQYSSTGQLAQLITNIRKQVLTAPDKRNASKKSWKEDISVMNSAEQTQDEEKGKKGKQKSSSKQEDSPKSHQSAAAGSSAVVSVRGLSNLGNTCFFNAVVQSLSQTQYLRELLKQIAEEKSSFSITPALSSELDPLQIQLERPGSLTLAMCQLMNEIQETKKGVVTPKELFTQVCKKAPRFKGFQQQDSQELLRYLLDGMRAEEAKRVNSGILEALKSSGKNFEAEQTKKIVKEYEKDGAPKNFVDRVFGGAMSSTVMCKECKTVSLVTEMFLDLSLPVADEAYRKKNQKKAVQHRHSVSDDGDQDTSSLANGNEDMPTGTGSKYQQKKAKKQAKKQAKNQRRQQKQGGKVTLDAITNQSSTDPADSSMQTQTVSVNGSADAQPADTNQEDLSLEKHNEDQDDEEPEQEQAASVNNRFTALSEDQTTEDIAEQVNEDEDEIEQNCAEEEELVEELNTMSLTTPSEGDVENGEDTLEDVKEYTVVNRDPELAFRALASRTAPVKQECSVESCLYQFTEVEHLTENNRLMCVTCTKQQPGYKDGCKKAVYRDALKQMLISDPPVVLTLHLKRFQQVAYSVCKVNRHVQFPQILDLAPFCSLNCTGVKEGETQVLYSLYGIVEHSGTMRSGHYTAYVKSRPSTHNCVQNGTAAASGDAEASKGSWFHISDSSVHPVPEAKVQSSQAYLLFYEKIS
ncbi:ubiquitin carboxyl-terminal hydrolase 16 isoform X1 [Danio rerio]|uniref:Ubiquitin carboxyl-terminal hydrolase 16 n=5 Tax=Danio rerio TaxID=7955 RepID=UBP16_DANRE|nr:ubiquitin carboxyl-terminal hydrolase 16 [Danio rerio]XP_009290187.1 ubiquitin carboxyl-terminal hydrolase 16 isoform X1 [Danio rerio]XP_021337123.1 ubiquitin carboxyl-terminal hydrolase 16 isoform X1 [Danio rerio]A8HAL1.1 RecName: Full=Ubiquitin carboxyl-terminal hydrolase 16; AltName: Full=Deubiquitinating enzyme 16; AltName: Full=Ubiquitin thioesterase 16; AltName: Full=Ubiquitin-specific-processing protease 16 [Danio rerio]|eukprot:NP_001139569.1 ubiquitin carboxyl-terminal hydrolase 16 [Danio rerio]